MILFSRYDGEGPFIHLYTSYKGSHAGLEGTTCPIACAPAEYHTQQPGGGGYSHILAIRVCTAGEGMVFKPFGLVKGMVFMPFGRGIGFSNHRKLVLYRVPFNGIAHKRLKSRTNEHFWSGRGSQNLQNLVE